MIGVLGAVIAFFDIEHVLEAVRRAAPPASEWWSATLAFLALAALLVRHATRRPQH